MPASGGPAVQGYESTLLLSRAENPNGRLAGVAGFGPANLGLKVPCLRPLGDTLLLPVFPGCQSAYIPEELIRGIGYIHPTTPLPDAEVSFQLRFIE